MKPAFSVCARMLIGLGILISFSFCGRETRRVIGVVPKSQAHIFWMAVHAGTLAAANESGFEIFWNAPATETDYARQVAILDDMINRQVEAVLLAPSDREALVPAIERVSAAGIPLTIFDSGANTEDYVSFVATDNYRGGVLGARRMAEILEGKGRVAMIGVTAGSASTLERENGFRETLAREFPDPELVAFQYGMSDRARSLAVAADILTAHPDLDGIFASNESGTIGAAQAVKSRGVAGKLKVIGFDTSPSLEEDLRTGVIDSLVLQDPFNMGYHAFMTLVDSLEGGRPPRRIDMTPTLATRENLEEPRIRALLDPGAQIDRRRGNQRR
ncbi:MAG: substrate-binding domain-containing protein [Acidobacteriota bacterium]